MSDQLVKAWEKAKKDLEDFDRWQNLNKGQTYQNDSMYISLDHCKSPLIMRAGQQYAGGQNYWPIPETASKQLLDLIVKDWGNLGPLVRVRLVLAEHAALIACQEYVSNLQQKIDAAMGKEV